MSRVGDAIVAPVRPPPAGPGWKLRPWRLWLAGGLILLAALLTLARALTESSLGFRFAMEGPHIVARPLPGGGTVLQQVTALRASGEEVAMEPDLLVESGGIINRYADQHRFYAQHARLWRLLQQPQVEIVHAGGVRTVAPEPKQVLELGLRFWYPWLVGLLCMSVGLGLWVYSPQRNAAWCFLASSMGFAYIMLLLAPGSSRLLTQAPTGWQAMHMATHVAAFIQNGALCLLLWNHPSRLGGRWFGAALVLWAALWLAVDFGEWVDTIAVGFRLPVALFGPLFALLFVLQWQRARGEPLLRAQLKWLTLLFALAFTVVFAAYVYGATGARITATQAYGLSWLALLYVGLVPLVSQVGLFRLEAWWTRAWMWFAGGVLVVALDAAFVALLSVQVDHALMLALALGGWAYFPLRQWIWRRLSRDGGASTRDLLPDVVALISRGALDAARLRHDWRALWDKLFEPLMVVPLDPAPEAACVIDGGRRLQVPGGEGLPGLTLELAARGRRLFTPQDARRANEMARLVLHGLRTQASLEASVRQERARIASDLHDDLGATLLTIAQAGDAPHERHRIARLARQALDEMRLSVRGLAGEAAPVHEAWADWRSETVTRLMQAGIGIVWLADEPPAVAMLPARTHVQLTRVLREAVSNVIRHSAAAVCTVRLQWTGERMKLSVQDNGQGLDPAAGSSPVGHGLPNIERRVRHLGGSFRLVTAPDGGALLEVEVPVQEPSATIAPS